MNFFLLFFSYTFLTSIAFNSSTTLHRVLDGLPKRVCCVHALTVPVHSLGSLANHACSEFAIKAKDRLI